MKTAVGEVQGEALTLVNTTNTAIAAESGSLPVLGTPFMLALMEKATCEVTDFEAGSLNNLINSLFTYLLINQP